MDNRLTVLVERCEAAAAAKFAHALTELDPSWKSEARPLAGGQLVLCGAGLYVNRGIAVGFDDPITDDDLDVVEARSAAVGVPPAVEVTNATSPESLATLERRQYRHDPNSDVNVFVQTLDESVPAPDATTLDRITIVPTSLAQWSEISAIGWGHASPEARRAADAFAAAAHAIDPEGMLIAVDANDGRALGCASLRIEGEVATLGGMSTLPDERGRGVQSALIRYRLHAAAQAGCSIAASSARCDSGSERNIVRHGFEHLTLKRTFVHQPGV